MPAGHVGVTEFALTHPPPGAGVTANYIDARQGSGWEPISFDVPCGGCTLCCQDDAVRIHPELGDDATAYRTEMCDGVLCLTHKLNGDCIYLERGTGCTIHSRRPAVCRELDCRVFLLRFTRKEQRFIVARGLLHESVLKQARKLRRRHGIPEALRQLVKERD